jgi:hypothetical protein
VTEIIFHSSIRTLFKAETPRKEWSVEGEAALCTSSEHILPEGRKRVLDKGVQRQSVRPTAGLRGERFVQL